ncbi:MauE/DoxX family redox-associated membrane protein [Nonomuraea candida]|uniref:MauE/DoxX family redox-associated membrane protein n=1 Tax=Nonomuraea candida TaxID=359159 RepID=UPI0006937E13|nr:MauE/DoxX family redox-associated membrane protein [Nonomuraea candida]
MVAIPAGGATVVSAAVILSEASVIVLLAVRPAAPAGFVLAGAVLLAFSAGIARAVRTGGRTPCPRLTLAPATRRTSTRSPDRYTGSMLGPVTRTITNRRRAMTSTPAATAKKITKNRTGSP